jgi:hypothetical protein
MKANNPKKPTYADIGCQGKAIASLARDKRLGAFLDLAQRAYESAYEENKCQDVFTVKK